MGQRDYMEIIADGDRFAAVRNCPEINEAMLELEQQFIESWLETNQPEIAHEIWHRARAVRQMRQVFQAKVDAGKLARSQMMRDGDYQPPEVEKPKKSTTRRRKAS